MRSVESCWKAAVVSVLEHAGLETQNAMMYRHYSHWYHSPWLMPRADGAHKTLRTALGTISEWSQMPYRGATASLMLSMTASTEGINVPEDSIDATTLDVSSVVMKLNSPTKLWSSGAATAATCDSRRRAALVRRRQCMTSQSRETPIGLVGNRKLADDGRLVLL